ncbi:hypothetical protein Anas_09437 [Armadillidium nasatum]|uniref:Uncharacterized protein n=1 Tax=Armadillidium nasatum TaxID=96803 RepID=A0A5N5SSD1_9CRUS|nr:hypothetical protein Anas_09437 [Armadillidium nasatum]
MKNTHSLLELGLTDPIKNVRYSLNETLNFIDYSLVTSKREEINKKKKVPVLSDYYCTFFNNSLETSKDVLIGSGMLKEEVEEDKESQEDFKDFEYPTDYLKEGERAHESDDGLSEDVGRKSKCVLTVIIQQYGIVLSKDTY